MRTQDAIDYFADSVGRNGARNLASRLRRHDGRLGINRQAVYQWGEYPPMGRQYEIEAMTAGKLRAEPLEATA